MSSSSRMPLLHLLDGSKYYLYPSAAADVYVLYFFSQKRLHGTYIASEQGMLNVNGSEKFFIRSI